MKKTLAQKPAGVPMADILERGLALSYEGARAEPLVILAYRLRDGEKVAEFESRPFEVSPDRTTHPRAAYLPPVGFYRNNGDGERFVSVTGFGTFIPAQRVIENPTEAGRPHVSTWWMDEGRRRVLHRGARGSGASEVQPSPLAILGAKPTTRP